MADPLYTLLFEGLWILADRAGRLEDRPLRIKAEVFPYRDANVDAMLAWLVSSEFILRYLVDGKRYIQILNFAKHQNPHKNETESDIPSPEGADAAPEEIGTASESIGSARADSLSTDSLSTDSLKEGARKRAPLPECPDDVEQQVWSDFVALRKAKRAPVTQTVVDGARGEASKAGMSLEAFLRVWCRRGSQGLEAAWLQPSERAPPTVESFQQRAARERVAQMSPRLAAKAPGSTQSVTEVIDGSTKLIA